MTGQHSRADWRPSLTHWAFVRNLKTHNIITMVILRIPATCALGGPFRNFHTGRKEEQVPEATLERECCEQRLQIIWPLI